MMRGPIDYIFERASCDTKEIVATYSRKEPSIDTDRIITGFYAWLINAKKETKGGGSNLYDSAREDLEPGDALRV